MTTVDRCGLCSTDPIFFFSSQSFNMEIDHVDSIEGSSDSGPETLENYSSIRKGKVSKGIQLQKRIISFSQIVDHKGDSIRKCTENVLIEWGIDKVFTITVDNATSNTTVIGYVIRKLNSWQDDGTVLGEKYLHVRCCAHILNLIVGDGLKDLHDSIVAIHNAVKFMKSSHSIIERFKKVVAHEKIGTKGYVKFRFDSIYIVEEFESMILELKGVLLDFYEWYDKFYGSSGGGAKQTDDVFSFGVGGGPIDDLEFSRLKATDQEDSLWEMKQQEEDINKGKSESMKVE
ncbi:hypothetical protein Ddye_018812 [Dipteronia dyeriana]|uniref:Transposase n=1 Tax=Dipteronia dyeriana TaxID=168575 RepID=A0AAD9UBX5_9ROSI|nr:hypothetical protein Ddye_018812 [Dipteronia dyeriana]